MANNKTDYNKPFSNIFELLPNVFRSDVSRALMENGFNRFVTKPEMEDVVGIVGQGNFDQKIKEIDPHRQANQLQPLIYNKIATVDYISSFKDLLRESARLGVDVSRFDEWGQSTKFNFAPPIDLDKLINWRYYYWLNDTNPQYVTIKNRSRKVNNIIEQGVSDIPELRALVISYSSEEDPAVIATLEQEIEQLYPGFVDLLREQNVIRQSNPINRVNPDGWDAIDWDPLINGEWGNPFEGLNVVGVTPSSFIVEGDFTQLFNVAPLFQFNVIDSQENTGAYEVALSLYNETQNQTEVFVNGGGVEDSIVDGKLAVSVYDLDGYDPLVDGNYDKDDGSDIEENPDSVNGILLQNDPWSQQNFWVHLSDIPSGVNLSLVRRATQPIIEYNEFLLLNQWSYAKQIWSYNPGNGFQTAGEAEPSREEVFSLRDSVFNAAVLDPINSTAILDINEYENLDTIFTPGMEISLETIGSFDFRYFTINRIVNETATGRFFIFFNESVPTSLSENDVRIHTIRRTSQGDDWKGFYFHWAHIGQESPVPVNRQPLNPDLVDGTLVEEQPATGTSTTWYRLNKTSFNPNNDELRVYVNNIRQYGNYVEGYWDGNSYSTNIPQNQKGNAIRFLNGVGSGTIRTEVGPAAQADQDFSSVIVRTSTSENFSVEERSIVRYRIVEQQKIEQTQYPLFDIFNLDGTTAYRADAIWRFKEDGSFSVNNNINKRTVNQGNIFSFEQTLLDYDDGPMYAYKERDGSLHTIWRKGLNDEKYVPKFINSRGEETIKTDPDGDWEIPQQMTNNLEHQNRRELTTTDLFQHFKSIIESQENPPGYTSDATNRWRVIDKINYGVGGSINEFNDGFDTFISSTFVRDVTVPTLLNFVRDRYENQQNIIRNRFQSDIDELLEVNSVHMTDMQGFITEHLINAFENNSRRDVVFGDSTTYDDVTNTGVRGWIATLPYVGLTEAVRPKLLRDETLGLLEITHHDGHIKTPTFDNGSKGVMLNNILKKDNAVKGKSNERLDIQTAPLGQVFYDTDQNKLYKMIVVRRGQLQPRDVPFGALWYDTVNNQLKQYVEGPARFEVVDDDLGWQEIDLDLFYANTILEIENRLYDNVPERTISYDLNQVLTDNDYTNLEQREFVAFAKQFNIVNPYVSDYNSANAFTWNYSNSSVSDFNLAQTPSNWVSNGVPARWYDIYQDIYGTRYPHLEPWVLQGYEIKPDWWDEQYQGTNRRWIRGMWNNIISTVVPVGRVYPTGEISLGTSTDGIINGGLKPYAAIPVNVTDNFTQDMLYGPDDLLPPFYDSSDSSDADILSFGQLVVNSPLMSDARKPYPFGTNGPMEDTWRRSSSYKYDVAEIAFLLDPIRFVHKTFGNDYVEVDGLTVDRTLNKVFSHRDVKFHGEIVNNQPLKVNGLNQWFVNFIRFNSYDLETADFKSMWIDWRPRLSYQSGAFIDTNSLSLSTDSQFFDNSDFEVLTKKTPGLVDAFADALMMVVNQVGSHRLLNGVRIPDGDGNDWKFRITTPNPSIRDVNIYGVNTNLEIGSFQALRGRTTNQQWKHYEIDKSKVLTFTPGDVIELLGTDYQGIQGLINFIDGYAAFLEDAGFSFGTTEFAAFDSITGRTMSWQVETEKMVDTIYNGMASDQLPVEFFGLWNYTFADIQNNVFRVTGNQDIRLRNGNRVQMSTTGNLPAPFKRTSVYYVVNADDQNNTFQLAQIDGGTPISIQTVGQGTHSVGMNRFEATSPTTMYEINPFRNQILINHEIGVLADVHDGSFVDIRNTQGVYDQYGRPLKQHHVNVFRRDKQSRIVIDTDISNDVIVSDPIDPEGRNLLHLGGIHVFMDGYEHSILLNRRTIEGNLLFDQFLGSSIRKINMRFRRQSSTSFRPNVGGYIVNDDKLQLNFEGSVEQIQQLYDAHLADENSEPTKAARNLIGFERKDYFDNMGITPKSQLLFHRGMIQHKGSTKAVKAFINSKRFIDANVDEFWAYKISEYGDSRKEVYPELSLEPRDTNNDKLMLDFLVGDERAAPNFISIRLDDTSRWYNHPEQIREVFKNDPNLYFETTVNDVIQVTGTQALSGIIELPSIVDGVKVVVNQREGTGQYIVPDNSGSFTFELTSNVVPQTQSLSISIKRDGKFLPNQSYNIDGTGSLVTIQSLRFEDGSFSTLQQGDTISYTVNNAVLVEDIHYRLVNAQNISFELSNSSFDLSSFDDVKIYCLSAAKTKLNPVKLIDRQSNVNVETIPIWDPAREHHYHNAENIVSYQQDTDPAFYTDSLVDNNIDANKSWKQPYEKLIWWDTTKRDYVPYYDKSIFPSVDVRTSEWGRLTQYGKIELFEWVSSPVPPSQYAEYIESQSGEITGEARLQLFMRERNPITNEFDQPWIQNKDIIHKLWGYQVTTPHDVSNVFEDGDIINVYVNGTEVDSVTVTSGQINLSNIDDKDSVTLIKPQYVPTEDELNFDPEIEDDQSINVQYKLDADYVKVDRVSDNGIGTDSTYYFWATKTGTTHNSLTITRAEQQLASIPTPFVIFQNLMPSDIVDVGDDQVILPDRYTQAIFRGLVNRIDSNNRYHFRFVKNFTLRDDYEDADTGLRQRHLEWKMIREKQKFNISRVLWDKMTEALSGRTLSDNPLPVPSLNRVLYDEEYGTSLRYGLREGQSLIPRNRGIDVLIKSIQDPNFDLYPVDREEFLATYKFDTPENIESAMDVIYTTFLPEHINRFWFAALYEGLANNIKYTDIFKTSWIQLDGVRLLDTSGVLE